MADTYTELTEAYEVVEGIDGITATRSFHDDGGTETALPAIGDRLVNDKNDPYYNVYVISRTKNKFGGHPNKHIWTIHYSSTPSASPQMAEDKANIDLLPISMSIGGELLSVTGNDTTKYKWKSGLAIKQTIPKKIGVGSITISKRLSNLPVGRIMAAAGCTNKRALTIASTVYSPGTLLFEGATAREYNNAAGLRRWQVDFTFAIKYITNASIASGSGTYAGWNHLYNELTGKYELVVGEGTDGIYPAIDLSPIINATETP